MSILIKDMEMPKSSPVCIVIDAAGQARRYDLNNDRYADDKLFEAVHVPAHGRLGDLDKLADNMRSATAGMEHRAVIMHEIRRAPTIIPAEEGKT